MNRTHLIDRSELPADVQQLVAGFEKDYNSYFGSLVHFGGPALAELHRPGPLPANVRVASAERPAVLERMAAIAEIANLTDQQEADRARYLRALLDIYALLPVQAAERAAEPGTAVIAPEREGRILAEHLGVTDRHGYWTPQAKRIPMADGLIVGVDEWLPSRAERVVIIDGVVASGVTLMAMMQLALQPGATVDVFTCHSTQQGALALARHAEQLGLRLTLHIGHVSGVLNRKFYAVSPDGDGTLVLGDVGDTIAPVAATRPAPGARP
ncbi:hypothetical protein [Kitasatospora cheerisanensis]|uniref:Phosphoribosyltransferase domain-containing protein n=1 Tax=Kitasatospora cheerisanensis KCTC 2395 TaxID=1348663 RepID=A0A066YRW8_9ACTN|nr:hypothetical protein [Kitasatospora cheerisanensis]KDN80836.1 hypothetical protein KCH_74710 [Kitasatospora cheerisanensis KCTC 2395]